MRLSQHNLPVAVSFDAWTLCITTKDLEIISKYPLNIPFYNLRQSGSISQPYGVKSALSCTITVIKLLFNFKSSFIVYILYNIFFKFSNFILSGRPGWTWTNNRIKHRIYSPGRYQLRCTDLYWHWWLDLNQRIQESKSCALPLGDTSIL